MSEVWQDDLLSFLAKMQSEDQEVTLQEFIDICTSMSKGKFNFVANQDKFTDQLEHIHSEVSEVYDEWRAGHHIDETYWKDGKPEGIGIELADVVIKTIATAGVYGIDLSEMIKIKMLHNATKKKKKK